MLRGPVHVVALRLVDRAVAAVGLGPGAWRPRLVLLGGLLGNALIAIVAGVAVTVPALDPRPTCSVRTGGPSADSWGCPRVDSCCAAPAALCRGLVFRGYSGVAEARGRTLTSLWSRASCSPVHCRIPARRRTSAVILAVLTLGTRRAQTDMWPAAWMRIGRNWIMAAVLPWRSVGCPRDAGYRGACRTVVAAEARGARRRRRAAVTMGAPLLSQYRGRTRPNRMKAEAGEQRRKVEDCAFPSPVGPGQMGNGIAHVFGREQIRRHPDRRERGRARARTPHIERPRAADEERPITRKRG